MPDKSSALPPGSHNPDKDFIDFDAKIHKNRKDNTLPAPPQLDPGISLMRAPSIPSLATCLLAGLSLAATARAENPVLTLWPGTPPGPPSLGQGDEVDTTQEDGHKIAKGRVVRLGNVTQPSMEVFLPPPGNATGTAVIICPGGGFNILAMDLEGTEVADWLNTQGIAGIVLKYRTPTGAYGDELETAPAAPELQAGKRAMGPMMDAQRALSLTRAHAEEWKLDPARIGILGFSAGGHTAALAACAQGTRAYNKIDATDEHSCAANFALLIYPAWLVKGDGVLRPEFKVDKNTPPMFFTHASDDPINCLSSTTLFNALKKSNIRADLHIYAHGGHGYGLRPTATPVTHWPEQANAWFRDTGLIPK